MSSICKAPNCPKEAKVSQLCWAHYTRIREYGSYDLPIMELTCVICGKVFTRSVRGGRTQNPTCSVGCRRESSRRRSAMFREEHLEELRERSKQYYQEHRDERLSRQSTYRKENREKVLAQKREYRERYPKRVAEQKKRCYLAKREQYLERARVYHINHPTRSDWAKKHPEQSRAIKRRYKVRRAGYEAIGHKIPIRALERVGNKSGWTCLYCGAKCKDNHHWDHVVPISRSGVHGEGNLVLACPKCNLQKSNKTIMEWRVWRRRHHIPDMPIV